MSPWLTTSVAAFVALGVVIYALVSGGRARRLEPAAPAWLLPRPDDVADLRFPLAFNGYDPAHVDAVLDPLVRAYAALYEAADDEAIASARSALEAPVAAVPEPVVAAVDGDEGEPQEPTAVT